MNQQQKPANLPVTAMANALQRNLGGLPLFSYGFRPFFLFGSIYAGLAVLVWMPLFYGEITVSSVFAPRDWHVHEMLFGYLPAVITGFLLTAIPNWTGRLPIRGAPLFCLVAVWFAGRVAVTFSAYTGWVPAMLIDAGFLLLVAAAASREILAGRNWRNMKVMILLLLTVRRRSDWRLLERAKLYRIVELIGRWSMLDVFVVSVLTGLVKIHGFANIHAGIGIAAFGAVVVLTMLASLAFDPRLIWDERPTDPAADVSSEPLPEPASPHDNANKPQETA